MSDTPLTLSKSQAQRIVLLSQGLGQKKSNNKNTTATLQNIKKMSYVQIDSISVVERAHHHTLWSRQPHYTPAFLDKLIKQKHIFEYWSHAAAYLPMQDYRYSLPRKAAIASGEKHWFERNPELNSQILKRIEQEGPLQAKDFEHKRSDKAGWWDWKPAKKALEQLYMEGKLMVSHRQNFQKVYDLTERVLPSSIDTSLPTDTEFCRHLITRYLHAHGIGTAKQISYLRKGYLKKVTQHCNEMLASGELIKVHVADVTYFALPRIESLSNKRINQQQLHILSPFDNLVIQRERVKQLFNFDYQIECYVPANKRQYGYFCLPLLLGQRFAGRLDAKLERKTQTLELQNLSVEITSAEAVLESLKTALPEYMRFIGANLVALKKLSIAGKSMKNSEFNHWCSQFALP
ncbi:winged helix-turn-helix domain-containing protein [Neptunicella marina]|uniref:YcaQ family DNA glycosylase n=1 Tax=Neptunicella marina TaxID=2125989 RepID=A0A8J6M2V8_9ALTE|nr:crosslink repair DNA glycosylase YcaQ family protein [Neptunicella marina]MBC3766778.1 YcaQ family DNA glycosylase [Neptunicella marina]